MTEVSHPHANDITTPEPPVSEHAHNRQDHSGRDWLLILLFIFVFLTFIAALLAAILLLLAFIVPGFAGFLTALTAQLPLISSLSGPQLATLLLGSSLLLSLTFYLLARWRILRKTFLWPSAGCPACGNDILLRIHRRRKDRLYAWIGIPVGRYQCRECRWKGLRIRRGSKKEVKSADWPTAVSTARSNSSAPVNANLRPEAKAAQNDEAVAKWQARLAGQQMAALAGDEGPPVEEGNAPTAEEERLAVDQPAAHDIRPDFVPYASAGSGDQLEEQAEPAPQPANNMTIAQISAPFGLNMRADPRPDGDLLRLLEPGTNVVLLDQVLRSDGTAWQHVQVAGQEGWVISQFLEAKV